MVPSAASLAGLVRRLRELQIAGEAAVCQRVVSSLHVPRFSEDHAASADLDIVHDAALAAQHDRDRAFVAALRHKIVHGLPAGSPGSASAAASLAATLGGALVAASSTSSSSGTTTTTVARADDGIAGIILLRSPGNELAEKWADLQLAPLFQPWTGAANNSWSSSRRCPPGPSRTRQCLRRCGGCSAATAAAAVRLRRRPRPLCCERWCRTPCSTGTTPSGATGWPATAAERPAVMMGLKAGRWFF
jgi:hypothetical protein